MDIKHFEITWIIDHIKNKYIIMEKEYMIQEKEYIKK